MKKYLLLGLACFAQPAFAQDDSAAYSHHGARIEVRVGYETPTISAPAFDNNQIYKIGNSATIGGEVGYDFAVGRHVTLGAFGNYEYAHSRDCDSYGDCLGSNGNLQTGLRAGLNLGSRSQLYVKGGYDSFRLYASVAGYGASKSLNGPMGALGLDYHISKHGYLGFEIDYADLGNFAGANFARRHVALTGGVGF